MKFRSVDKLTTKLFFRLASLDDAEILSDIQWEYFHEYSYSVFPRSVEKFRLAIGSSMLKGERFLIVEDSSTILGFIEQRQLNAIHSKISYPYIQIDHTEKREIQIELTREIINRLKKVGIKYVSSEFSAQFDQALSLFKKLDFDHLKAIYQQWEGENHPLIDLEIEPYSIRRVKAKDVDVAYKWVSKQLDRLSPLYISKETFSSLVLGPSAGKEGWAMATLDGNPVCFVSSLIEPRSDTVVIFGPFAEEGHSEARIPLLNELFLHYRLAGIKYIRMLRIKEFDNDEELFTTFNLTKVEEINYMTKLL